MVLLLLLYVLLFWVHAFTSILSFKLFLVYNVGLRDLEAYWCAIFYTRYALLVLVARGRSTRCYYHINTTVMKHGSRECTAQTSRTASNVFTEILPTINRVTNERRVTCQPTDIFDPPPRWIAHLVHAVLIGGRVGKTTLRHKLAQSSPDGDSSALAAATDYSAREMDMGGEVSSGGYRTRGKCV